MFLDVINKTPDLDDALKTDYKAQITFLIGYYHYLLTRCYGSIIWWMERLTLKRQSLNMLTEVHMIVCRIDM